MMLYKIERKNFNMIHCHTLNCIVCCNNIEEAYNLWPEDVRKEELEITLIGISVPKLEYGIVLEVCKDYYD